MSIEVGAHVEPYGCCNEETTRTWCSDALPTCTWFWPVLPLIKPSYRSPFRCGRLLCGGQEYPSYAISTASQCALRSRGIVLKCVDRREDIRSKKDKLSCIPQVDPSRHLLGFPAAILIFLSLVVLPFFCYSPAFFIPFFFSLLCRSYCPLNFLFSFVALSRLHCTRCIVSNVLFTSNLKNWGVFRFLFPGLELRYWGG